MQAYNLTHRQRTATEANCLNIKDTGKQQGNAKTKNNIFFYEVVEALVNIKYASRDIRPITEAADKDEKDSFYALQLEAALKWEKDWGVIEWITDEEKEVMISASAEELALVDELWTYNAIVPADIGATFKGISYSRPMPLEITWKKALMLILIFIIL
jgi:hypothetical protein